jgi:hypothetical protein
MDKEPSSRRDGCPVPVPDRAADGVQRSVGYPRAAVLAWWPLRGQPRQWRTVVDVAQSGGIAGFSGDVRVRGRPPATGSPGLTPPVRTRVAGNEWLIRQSLSDVDWSVCVTPVP